MPMFVPAPLPKVALIQERLARIFPEGISDRNYLIREVAAKTIFVMLYIDAIAGNDIWLAPKHVYKMTDQQAQNQTDVARAHYCEEAIKPKFSPVGVRWYADNTRESIRDETLRDGLKVVGAVTVKTDLPTTSSKGRYTLAEHFARLFCLTDDQFEAEVESWQNEHLSASRLAKVRIMQQRQQNVGDITVQLPNGQHRVLSAGPSSFIAKSVVEEFTKYFLSSPAVLWISESGKKVVVEDDVLLRDLGLEIDQKTLLPDMILADVGGTDTLLVFVEVVATDGPITEVRKAELEELTTKAGYKASQVAFVTAFEDRNAAPLKKRLSSIAVNSAVWCMAEPDTIIWIGDLSNIPFQPVELTT